MIRVIADENIAHIQTYLGHHDSVQLITMAGRDINHAALQQHRPDALFIRSVSRIDRETLADFRPRFVGSATIGTDHVDTALLEMLGIAFHNAAGCSKHSVAQYVITAIIHTLGKNIKKNFTIGIVGLGNIGSTLATYAQKMGWSVLGFDPFIAPSSTNNTSFDELLANSDAISIHTPLTHTGTHPTFELFNHATFAKMSPNALLINSARGEIIQEAALLADICQNDRRVILDVFPDEPTINQPLLDALTIATPHIAGYTLEGKLRGTDMIYQAFCQAFSLPILQTLPPLLPENPFSFAKLLANDFENLPSFYDIQADFIRLKNACNDSGGIDGKDFDHLRKTYPLRREWSD